MPPPFLVLELKSGCPCPQGMEARHLDDVKRNNRLYNLAYGTRLQNRHDRIKNGHDHRVGLKCSTPKLTELDVVSIRQSNLRSHVLAEKYSVSARTIQAIRNNETWKSPTGGTIG